MGACHKEVLIFTRRCSQMATPSACFFVAFHRLIQVYSVCPHHYKRFPPSVFVYHCFCPVHELLDIHISIGTIITIASKTLKERNTHNLVILPLIRYLPNFIVESQKCFKPGLIFLNLSIPPHISSIV